MECDEVIFIFEGIDTSGADDETFYQKLCCTTSLVRIVFPWWSMVELKTEDIDFDGISKCAAIRSSLWNSCIVLSNGNEHYSLFL